MDNFTRPMSSPHGRPLKPIDEMRFAEVAERWRAGEITTKQASAELELSESTFYRNIKRRNMSDGKQPLKEILIPQAEYYRLKRAAGEE